MTKYMHGERQRAAIIQSGLDLWRDGGAGAVTARGIGKLVGLSHAGVLFHFEHGIAGLREQVKAEAIARADPIIIPQLVLARDPAVAHWTEEQRRAWLNSAA